jgi:hypothetical protein
MPNSTVVIDTFKYRILNLKRRKLKIRSKEHGFITVIGIGFFIPAQAGILTETLILMLYAASINAYALN